MFFYLISKMLGNVLVYHNSQKMSIEKRRKTFINKYV